MTTAKKTDEKKYTIEERTVIDLVKNYFKKNGFSLSSIESPPEGVLVDNWVELLKKYSSIVITEAVDEYIQKAN